MDTYDPATDWRRLTEHYGRMSDEELLILAGQKSELTDVAQEALANEVRQRRLTVPSAPVSAASARTESSRPAPFRTAQFRTAASRPTPSNPESESDSKSDSDSDYAEERRLVEIRTVWSVADALQLQDWLDRAGIPFFMGEEKATGVDSVTSNFADGVSVQVMSIGWPWAQQVLQNYEPANEPRDEPIEEVGDVAVRCPKCHSTEVVFDELTGEPPTTEKDSPQQYEWTCDSCGHRWKDDGIVKEQ